MKKKILVMIAAMSLCAASLGGCSGKTATTVTKKNKVSTQETSDQKSDGKSESTKADDTKSDSETKQESKASSSTSVKAESNKDTKDSSSKSTSTNKTTGGSNSTDKTSGSTNASSSKTTTQANNTTTKTNSSGGTTGTNSSKASSGSSGSNNASSGGSATNTSKNNAGSGSSSSGSSSTPAHTHNWVEQTKTVHHDAEYTVQWVQDSAAWDEPVYEEQAVYESIDKVRCRGCLAVFDRVEEYYAHRNYYEDDLDDGGHGAYEVIWERIQTGTQTVQTGTIHHDATGHNEQILVKAAYDETVVTGYRCSGCGATK